MNELNELSELRSIPAISGNTIRL